MIKKLAISSVLMGLCIVCLFIGSIWPVKIAMCLMASFIVSIVVVECGHKYAWLVYIGVTIISFLLIPKKIIVYGFIAFLGFYPIIKLYIERLNKLWVEWIAKFIFFNIILILAYFALNYFLLPSLDIALVGFVFKYIASIIAVSEIVFLIYDLAVSYFISYYRQNLRRYIKI
ncbi:MAG: hypothetical protein E7404_09175 [Ruminococcaceae bacterium]|nr:hypothetical protein [Oscillospiraceae bacterium]